MNKLNRETRARVLHLLCEGSSLRAVTRVTGVSKKAVSRLMVDAGQAAAWYQDRVFRNLNSKRIQVDEIWAFVYAKQKNVPHTKAAPANAGDVWTWTAIDADTKLIPSWFVGGRDSDAAIIFMDDLKSRLANRVQLTSDGHKAYLEAVEGAFGADVDYAQLVKLYGESPDAEKRYSPAVCIGAHKNPIEGNPDPKYISTSYAERQNLNVRMHTRRFTRLTNAFSKKVENHAHSVALFAMYYNFVRIHKTLRTTPAMAAGVTSRLWEIGDIGRVGSVGGYRLKGELLYMTSMAQPKPFALKATITLFLLWLVALSANAQTYYQAPYTGTGAPCVARTDLSGLPLNNDDPGLISTKELINEARPGATGDSTRDQSYLQVSNVEPLDHRCIGSQCGATQLSFTLPFRRKISYNISLIFETQAIRFHGYLRGAAWWVGTPDTWPALPDYEVYPDFSQFCRVWNTGHSTQHNMSVRVLLPWPNSFQLGDYTTILIDDQYGGGRNRMWVIAD